MGFHSLLRPLERRLLPLLARRQLGDGRLRLLYRRWCEATLADSTAIELKSVEVWDKIVVVDVMSPSFVLFFALRLGLDRVLFVFFSVLLCAWEGTMVCRGMEWRIMGKTRMILDQADELRPQGAKTDASSWRDLFHKPRRVKAQKVIKGKMSGRKS